MGRCPRRRFNIQFDYCVRDVHFYWTLSTSHRIPANTRRWPDVFLCWASVAKHQNNIRWIFCVYWDLAWMSSVSMTTRAVFHNLWELWTVGLIWLAVSLGIGDVSGMSSVSNVTDGMQLPKDGTSNNYIYIGQIHLTKVALTISPPVPNTFVFLSINKIWQLIVDLHFVKSE